MTVKLTKGDLRIITEHLSSLRPPGPRPLTVEQLVRLDEVITKMHGLIDTVRASPERGELVFSWRVPKEWAMTLNEYAGKTRRNPWLVKELKADMDAKVNEMFADFPRAPLHGARLRRWARVTRFSSRRPDELAVDIIGGKAPLDSLTRCGVVVDDNDKWLIREARWEPIKRGGDVHVLIEVWALTQEGAGVAEPRPAQVQQVLYEPAPMTRAILGSR